MIFAVGFSCCGMKTLAQVLDIPHEAALLPWSFSQTKYDQALKLALHQGGAVVCYWLPYRDCCEH